MAYVDPWSGFNSATDELNSSLQNIRRSNLQERLASSQLANSDQERQMNALKLQALTRESQGKQTAIDAYNNATGTTTTTIAPSKPSATSSLNIIPGGKYVGGVNSATLAPSGSLDSEMAANGLTDQPTAQPFTMPQSAASPTVQAYNEGRVSSKTTPPDRTGAMVRAYMAAGMTGEAEKVLQSQVQAINLDEALAKHKAEIDMGGGDPAHYHTQKMALDISKEMIGTIAPLAAKPSTRGLAQSILDGYKKTFSNQPEVQAMTLDNFNMSPTGAVMTVKDENGQPVGHYVLDPSTGMMKFEKSNNAELAHNVIELTSPDGKTARKWQYNPQSGEYDKPLGESYAVKSQVPNVNVKVNASTEDQVQADKAAIMAGNLAPSALGKRNGHDAKVRAAILAEDPNFNFTQAEIKAKLALNAKVQDKAGNAVILPDLIQDVAESGKKLNYSSNALLGKGGQWWDKMTNNPDYINYAAKRNDIIMRIGGVMRENGMTDQAQKLEEDSAPRSMSPPAFDAWAKAQMTVLKPIMEKYTSQAQGRGTPMGQGGGKGGKSDPLGIR